MDQRNKVKWKHLTWEFDIMQLLYRHTDMLEVLHLSEYHLTKNSYAHTDISKCTINNIIAIALIEIMDTISAIDLQLPLCLWNNGCN